MRKTPILLAWAAAALSIAAAAQTTAQPADSPAPPTAPAPAGQTAPQAAAPQAAAAPQPADNAAPSQSASAAADKAGKTIEVPAGTKVLLALRSGVNTKTAQPGDGVYLSSTFPVIAGGHVVIPSGVYVQGVIDNVVRPGRVKGRAQVTMHFTTLIFPNGSVVSIPGAVDGLPGSDGPTVKKNGEGTIEQSSSKGKDAATVATTAATGAGLGGIIGAASTRFSLGATMLCFRKARRSRWSFSGRCSYRKPIWPRLTVIPQLLSCPPASNRSLCQSHPGHRRYFARSEPSDVSKI
jgi:hypothetical protein